MKKVIPYLLLCITSLCCKKEEIVVVITPTVPSIVQLNIDQVINDSTIVLKWSKYSEAGFQMYQLVRTTTYLKDGQFQSSREAVDSSTDVDHISFTENNMPLARDIVYELYVSKDTNRLDRGFQYVNGTYYRRPNSILYAMPTDVLINSQHHKLYITEERKITVVDYTNGKIILSKDFPVSIGFCSLGDFNGSNELYVPINDGWLQILDAETLQLKDRIYVAGYHIGSVVAGNGKLYVGSSDMSAYGYSDCIKVYDRSTKTLIGRTGYWDRTRLLFLEGSTTEMIDLSMNLMPIDLCYYQFNSEGLPLSKKQDQYHGDYSMDPNIVRSFPDGSKFITSSSGTIFNKSLVFDRYIKQYGNYSDFAFNNDGSLIYAAYATEKKIDIIAYPATTTIGSYSTAYYPYKIFRDGNMLISLSKTYIDNYLLIEKINF